MRLMRKALARRPTLSFEAGYARRVKCNKRISPIRVRCKMSWNVGDLSFEGTGLIWLTYEQAGTYWNYAYRIRKRTSHITVVVSSKEGTR